MKKGAYRRKVWRGMGVPAKPKKWGPASSAVETDLWCVIPLVGAGTPGQDPYAVRFAGDTGLYFLMGHGPLWTIEHETATRVRFYLERKGRLGWPDE